MTNTQRLVLVLAFIFALLVGIVLATTLLGSRGGPAPSTLQPSGSAAASIAPSGGSAAASASSSASASPSASASASPSPTPKPAATANIRFVQLALDAESDPGGTTRSVSFVAQPGSVTVQLSTESGGNTTMCLSADGAQVGCRTAVTGTIATTTAKASTTLTVTLRGAGAATPVVDLGVAFPATKPKATIANARFDGTDFPTTNGLQVVATPRGRGNFVVSANWGGHPFLYEVDLIEQGGPGLKQVTSSSGATNTTQRFAVAPPNAWMIVLKNSEGGFGATPLTATFTWP